MKKINLADIKNCGIVEIPEDTLKDINAGCWYTNCYSSCNGAFLHSYRNTMCLTSLVFCFGLPCGITSGVETRYHSPGNC